MQFLNQSYYVGLLSAAALHGASHQKPQVFQVITDRYLSPIKPLNLKIEPLLYGDMDLAITMIMKSITGYFKVSSPEWTAIDLFRFPHRAAGYGNIMTVLVELSESLSSKVRLNPSLPYKPKSLDRKWKVVVNDKPESDI